MAVRTDLPLFAELHNRCENRPAATEQVSELDRSKHPQA